MKFRFLAAFCVAAMGTDGAVASTVPRAFITDFDNARVQIVDTVDLVVIGAVAVGQAPQGATLSPDGQRLYVVSQNEDNVYVIDTTTSSVVGPPIGVGDQPYGVVASPDGERLYVTNHNGTGTGSSQFDTVSVIDTTLGLHLRHITVGDFPIGIDILPDGSKVFVANALDGSVSVIDTATQVEETAVQVEQGPYWLSVGPSGARVFVSSLTTNFVTVIDTATLDTTSIDIGMVSQGVVVVRSPPRAFVTNQEDDRVTVMNSETLSIDAPPVVLPTGVRPYGVGASPEGDRIYVANGLADTVSVIDTTTLAIIETVAIGGQPGTFGRFVEETPLFADGFESGDTSAWL